jgi:hypothetical protein
MSARAPIVATIHPSVQHPESAYERIAPCAATADCLAAAPRRICRAAAPGGYAAYRVR